MCGSNTAIRSQKTARTSDKPHYPFCYTFIMNYFTVVLVATVLILRN